MVKALVSVESMLMKACVGLTYCVYSVIIVTTFASVFFRYVLNDSLVWAEELARYLFVWLVFLGSAIAMRDGLHIGLDLLASSLRVRHRLVLDFAITTLVVVFLVFAIHASATVVQITMRNKSSAMEIPMGLVYLAIPVGCALMLLSSVRKLAQILASARSGETLYAR